MELNGEAWQHCASSRTLALGRHQDIQFASMSVVNHFATHHGKIWEECLRGKMPVPSFTIHGVLPPYVGPNGPGGSPSDMSPYEASVLEVAQRFSGTAERRAILRDWLQHRADMAGLGLLDGFQWIDGSFVEDKIPADIDVITFFHRPKGHELDAQIGPLILMNADVLRRPAIKARLKVDAMFVDLDSTPERIVGLTRYYGSLFSHRRGDDLWKGMINVPLDVVNDVSAIELLDALDMGNAAAEVPAGPQADDLPREDVAT